MDSWARRKLTRPVVKLENLKPGESVLVAGTVERAYKMRVHFEQRWGEHFPFRFQVEEVESGMCRIRRIE
jgi:hypothetical protein